MKVKKYGEDSREKKVSVPAFLNRGVSDMKRSSVEFYNTSHSEKTLNSTNSSALFNSAKIRKKVTCSDF